MRTEILESQLRWRWERLISVVSVLFNLGFMFAVIAIVAFRPEWLEFHPVLADRITELRLMAIAAVLAPPAIGVMRNTRRGRIRGNAVRLSHEQMPEIHRILQKQCERLGMTEIPELYLSKLVDDTRAFSAWKRSYIVLSTDNLGTFRESDDHIQFFLGRKLGAIRLGHTAWWNELMLWYVLKLPWISWPVLRARALSEDRYGAFLAPDGLRTLLLIAAGRHMSRSIDVQNYLLQVKDYGSFWDWIAAFGADTPPIARRVKALHEAGLIRWDIEADVE